MKINEIILSSGKIRPLRSRPVRLIQNDLHTADEKPLPRKEISKKNDRS